MTPRRGWARVWTARQTSDFTPSSTTSGGVNYRDWSQNRPSHTSAKHTRGTPHHSSASLSLNTILALSPNTVEKPTAISRASLSLIKQARGMFPWYPVSKTGKVKTCFNEKVFWSNLRINSPPHNVIDISYIAGSSLEYTFWHFCVCECTPWTLNDISV